MIRPSPMWVPPVAVAPGCEIQILSPGLVRRPAINPALPATKAACSCQISLLFFHVVWLIQMPLATARRTRPMSERALICFMAI